MNRLNKHKESTRLASGSGDSSMTAAERRERVQQLLMERQTRLSSEGTARKGGSAAGGSIGRHSTPTRGARGGVDVRTGFFGSESIAAASPRASFKTPGREGTATFGRPSSAPMEWNPRTGPQPFNLSVRKAGRHSKEAVAAKIAVEEAKDLTFKPRTRTVRRPASARAEFGSRQDRIARLSTPRTKLWEKCEQEKEQLAGERDGLDECTFKPKLVTKKTVRPSSAFPQRLYGDAENRYKHREAAKRQLAEAEVASYPFQPAINDNSRAAVEAEGYAPIHERVGELLRKKQEALAAARVQVELENPDLTFAPKVSNASRAIARGLEEEAGVDARSKFDRLASGVSFTDMRRASVGGGTATRSSRRSIGGSMYGEGDFSFAPRLNENTRRLCEMMAEEGVRGGNGSFLDRQQEHAARSKEKKAAIRAKSDGDCTFHPNTGNAAEVLMKSKHVVKLGETPQERVARLAFLESQEKDIKQKIAEENYHKQFTYKPKISKDAKTKSATPLEDLVTNKRTVEVRAAAAAAAAEQFNAECTFEPNLGRRHEDAKPRPFQVDYSEEGGIVARIREYRREKEICLQEARNEKEFKELEACTFQPNAGVKKPKPKSQNSKSVAEVVPGLGRHLELRQRAKQMEDEAKARAAKVFLEDAVKKDVAHRQTVPKQPRISAYAEHGVKAETRKKKLVAEKEARERAECTFQPRTNEAPRKELIEALLAEDDELAPFTPGSAMGRSPY